MPIEYRSTAEVQALKRALRNCTRFLEHYDSDSRNPGMLAVVNTQLDSLKLEVDATLVEHLRLDGSWKLNGVYTLGGN